MKDDLDSDSIRFALTAIYVALCEAMALSTGKPASQLADFLIHEMTIPEAPEGAKRLLGRLARGESGPPRLN